MTARSIKRLLFGTAGVFFVAASADVAQAQIFCPTSISPAQGGVQLQNGTCTNGTTGAFSNAALGSVALTDLSQSATQETTRTAVDAIAERRRTEAAREPQRQAQPQPRPQAQRTPAARRPAGQRRAAAPAALPVYKAVPAIIETGPRVAAWARVFGDYERRTGSSATTINCCTNAVAGGLPINLALDATSRTTTGGVLGGLDVTFRNLMSAGDGAIFGILGGYTDSTLKLTMNSISGTPANLGNGTANLTANVRGGSFGVFATYFSGGFTIDNTVKVDFFDLNESFTDRLAFTANVLPNVIPLTLDPSIPAFSTFSNSGSTRLTNFSSFGNINYKIVLTDAYWIEPTVGYNYTRTDYASSAAQLGLTDGELLRLQGGLRFGVESMWDRVRVTTTLTGIAYENVVVNGGVLQNAAFGAGNVLLLQDQGKIRGQGILAFNFDFGGGFTSFLQAEVRGGENLFGAGGKGGVRWQW